MTEENKAQAQEPIELKPGDNPAAVVAAVAPAESPKEQLKIIMTFRDGGALIGIQRPDCDPVLSKLAGTLASILSAMPGLIIAADQKWKAAKRNPASTYKPPAPPAPAPTPKSVTKPKPKSPDVKKADGSTQTGLKL